jgi:hypothetical protein
MPDQPTIQPTITTVASFSRMTPRSPWNQAPPPRRTRIGGKQAAGDGAAALSLA